MQSLHWIIYDDYTIILRLKISIRPKGSHDCPTCTSLDFFADVLNVKWKVFAYWQLVHYLSCQKFIYFLRVGLDWIQALLRLTSQLSAALSVSHATLLPGSKSVPAYWCFYSRQPCIRTFSKLRIVQRQITDIVWRT